MDEAEYQQLIGIIQAYEKVREEYPMLVRRYFFKKYYHMHLDNFVQKECQEAYNDGFVHGKLEGAVEGRDEERKALARTLIADSIYTNEQIAQMLKVPLSMIESLCSPKDDFRFAHLASNKLEQEIAERNPHVAAMLSFEEKFKNDPELMRQYLESERAIEEARSKIEASPEAEQS